MDKKSLKCLKKWIFEHHLDISKTKQLLNKPHGEVVLSLIKTSFRKQHPSEVISLEQLSTKI